MRARKITYVLSMDDFSIMRLKVGEAATLREAKKMAVEALQPYTHRSVTIYGRTPRTFRKITEIEATSDR